MKFLALLLTTVFCADTDTVKNVSVDKPDSTPDANPKEPKDKVDYAKIDQELKELLEKSEKLDEELMEFFKENPNFKEYPEMLKKMAQEMKDEREKQELKKDNEKGGHAEL